MELYDKLSSDLSRKLALGYSNSFSLSARMYGPGIRQHIYNIYAWVRVGDEIVDTYRGHNADKLIEQYRKDTHQALKDGYSPNPIIHAFAFTAHAFNIGLDLVDPFLNSMAMDINPPHKYTKSLFDTYIHGASQTVALMCLKVFTADNEAAYEHLRPGAESLAAAFQKINFLRNFSRDTKSLGRSYFPNVRSGILTEEAKQKITNDIRHEITHAIPALDQLPKEARGAIKLSTRYYYELLNRLESATAEMISTERITVPEWRKAQIFATARTSRSFKPGPAKS